MQPLLTLCLFVLISMKFSTKSEPVLRHVASVADIYNGSSKTWHQYIRAFLNKCFTIFHHLTIISMQKTALWQKQLSENFEMFAHIMAAETKPKFRTHSYHTKTPPTNSIWLCRYKAKPYATSHYSETTVSRASGQLWLRLTYHSWRVCTNNIHHTWTLHLNAKLELNFTLHELYFQTKFTDCTKEQLHIFTAVRNITTEASNGQTFVYCGQHSVFTVHPNFQHIFARVYISMQMFVKLSAIFSVMDNSIVLNAETDILSAPDVYLAYMFRNNISSLIYSIQVKKTFKVVVTVATRLLQKFVMFDGPSLLCEILQNTGHIQEASSHQCMLQVITQACLLCRKALFQYSSEPLPISLSVFLQNTTIVSLHLPFNRCGPRTCIVHVHAEHRNQVNATAKSISYDGTPSITCKYGGIFAGEDLIPKSMEGATLCQNGDMSSRSFYSKYSSLKVMLYKHKEHAHICVTFTLSQTECNAVQMDICWINIMCPYLKVTAECFSFLDAVAVSSRLELYTTGRNRLMLSSVSQECMILQIIQIGASAPVTRTDKKHCSLSFRPEPTSFSNVTVTLGITGHIQHIPRQNHHDGLRIGHILDKVCQASNCSLEKMCETWTTKNVLTLPKRQMSAINGTLEFCLTVTKMAPLKKDDLIIDASFGYSSNSWIEIQIKTTALHLKALHNKESRLANHFDEYKTFFLPVKLSREKFEEAMMLYLTKRNSSGTTLINRLTLSTCVERSFYVRFGSILWRSYITLTDRYRYKFISIPGYGYGMHRREVSFHSIASLGSDVATGSELTVAHFRDIHKKYSHLEPNLGEIYESHFNLSRKVIRLACSKLSSQTQNKHPSYMLCSKPTKIKKFWENLFFYFDQTILQKAYQNIQHFSWAEASRLCSSHRSTLPKFTNREELDRLIAFMHMAEVNQVKPIEGLYIGLLMDNASEVCTCLLVPLVHLMLFPNRVGTYLASAVHGTLEQKWKWGRNCVIFLYRPTSQENVKEKE